MKVKRLLCPSTLPTVAAVLDQVGVKWWLDQGSLLGLVRDGKFIPWDHDIDIGVWEVSKSDKKRLVEALRERFDVCYLDELNNTVKVFFFDAEAAVIWWYDLSFYLERDGMAVKFWAKPRGAGRGYRVCIGLAAWLRGFSTPAAHAPGGRVGQLFLRFISKTAAFLGVNDVSAKALEKIAKRCFADFVEVRVPASMFHQLRCVDFGGVFANVPQDYEGYLRLKYGVSWRIPTRKWDYFVDDGGVVSRLN